MAAVVDADDLGAWVSLDCDEYGCHVHVAGRPVPPMSTYDLLCAVFDDAADAGWLLDGRTYCPQHRDRRERRRRGKGAQVGDAFDWARVRRGAPPGRYGPS
jgi:hypothetical protein